MEPYLYLQHIQQLQKQFQLPPSYLTLVHVVTTKSVRRATLQGLDAPALDFRLELRNSPRLYADDYTEKNNAIRWAVDDVV